MVDTSTIDRIIPAFIKSYKSSISFERLLTRGFAVVVYLLWAHLYNDRAAFGDRYLKTGDCQPVEVLRKFTTINVDIPIADGHSPTFTERLYKLKEYNMYGRAKKDDSSDKEKDEIPVLFIPGLGDSIYDEHILAQILYNRTVKSETRFRFYVIDAPGEPIDNSGHRISTLHFFVYSAVKHLSDKFKPNKVIVIGHSYGGLVAATLMMREDGVNNTDLIIMKSSPLVKPIFTFDKTMRDFYRTVFKVWVKVVEKTQTGVVSYNGGLKDASVDPSLTKFPYTKVVPAWTIPSISDTGLRKKQMFVCDAFLEHVSDLIMQYAKLHKEMTGKEILNLYYATHENWNIAGLPVEWKREVLPNNTILLTTDMKMYRELEEQHWLEVKLRRDEYIDITVTGECLLYATLIRDRREMRRREAFFNPLEDKMQIRFMIFDATYFEDIRIMISSKKADCSVKIETSAFKERHWYTFHKGVSQNVQSHWIGIYITLMFLMMIEGDKRSVRTRLQLSLYLVHIAATLYQTHHTIGTKYAALIAGAGQILYYVIPFSALEGIMVYIFRRQCEYLLQPVINRYYGVLIIFSMLVLVFSPDSGFYLAFITQLGQVKFLLTLFFLASTLPLGIITYNRWTPDIIGLKLGTIHFTMVLGIVIEGVLAALNKPIERTTYHIVCIGVFIFQFFHADLPLQYHFGAFYILLVLNRYVVQYIPAELQKGAFRSVDLETLEHQFEEFEREDDD